MSTVDDMAQAAKLAYGDVPQAAYAVGKGAYQRAQNAGMRFQNWRHKGAGDELAPAQDPYPNAGKTIVAEGPRGKNWTTETNDETTYYYHTKSTRKESR